MRTKCCIRVLVSGLLLLAMLLVALPVTGWAADAVSVPVRQSLTADATASVTYTLSPDAPSNPMPPEAQRTLTLSGSAEGAFAPIPTDVAGDFWYTLRAEKTQGCTVTPASCRVLLRVRGDGSVSVFAYNEDGKKSEITFALTPVAAVSPSPAPTPNSTAPVKTGDEARPAVYLALMSVSGAVLLVLCFRPRRKRQGA